MSDEEKCCDCGRTVSYETGFAISGTLAEGSVDSIYCPDCDPNKGKGYTLADLEKWREDNQVNTARYRIDQMSEFGPDVYFHVLNTTTAPDCIHCGHPYSVHKRHDAPADVPVYMPCTVCDCKGWSDNDPHANT